MPIIFIENKEITLKGGEELVDVADLPVKFGCRRGKCGVCAVEVFSGFEMMARQAESEREVLEKKKGLDASKHRLACQCAVNGDISLRAVTPFEAS